MPIINQRYTTTYATPLNVASMIWGKPTPPSNGITVQAQQELSSRGAVKYIYDVDKDGKPDITPTVKLNGNSSVCSQTSSMGYDALNFLRAK